MQHEHADPSTLFPAPVFSTSQKPLGKGGQATVWAAEWRGEQVAAKIYHDDQALPELNVSLNLRHPNVIRLLGAFVTGNAAMLLMERCKTVLATAFSDIEASKRLFSPKCTLAVLSGLARGVSYLHKNDVLHRDLKLENMLLSRYVTDPEFVADDVKICDFGISRVCIGNNATTNVGTFQYMAPEVSTLRQYSMPADMWSVGCIMLELLSRKRLSVMSTAKDWAQVVERDFILVALNRMDADFEAPLRTWLLALTKALLSIDENVIPAAFEVFTELEIFTAVQSNVDAIAHLLSNPERVRACYPAEEAHNGHCDVRFPVALLAKAYSATGSSEEVSRLFSAVSSTPNDNFVTLDALSWIHAIGVLTSDTAVNAWLQVLGVTENIFHGRRTHTQAKALLKTPGEYCIHFDDDQTIRLSCNLSTPNGKSQCQTFPLVIDKGQLMIRGGDPCSSSTSGECTAKFSSPSALIAHLKGAHATFASLSKPHVRQSIVKPSSDRKPEADGVVDTKRTTAGTEPAGQLFDVKPKVGHVSDSKPKADAVGLSDEKTMSAWVQDHLEELLYDHTLKSRVRTLDDAALAKAYQPSYKTDEAKRKALFALHIQVCKHCGAQYFIAENEDGACKKHLGDWHSMVKDCGAICALRLGISRKLGSQHWSCCYSLARGGPCRIPQKHAPYFEKN